MKQISNLTRLIIFGSILLVTSIFLSDSLLPKNKNKLKRQEIKQEQVKISGLTERFPELTNELNLLSSYVQKTNNYPPLPPLKFVILTDSEDSSLLKKIQEDFKTRKIMMATVEDYYQVIKDLNLDVTNTVIIDKNMLQTYLGDKLDINHLTENQIIVGKVIIHELEHLKQQKILDESGMKITLDTLFWKNNRPTASNRLIEALTDARLHLDTTPGYRGEEILQTINTDRSRPVPTQYPRFSQIYVLYKDLMDKLDKKQPIEKQQAQDLIKKLQELNKSASNEELKLLKLTL